MHSATPHDHYWPPLHKAWQPLPNPWSGPLLPCSQGGQAGIPLQHCQQGPLADTILRPRQYPFLPRRPVHRRSPPPFGRLHRPPWRASAFLQREDHSTFQPLQAKRQRASTQQTNNPEYVSCYCLTPAKPILILNRDNNLTAFIPCG